MAATNVLSNAVNDGVWLPHYQLDPARAVAMRCLQDRLGLPHIDRRPNQRLVTVRPRNRQTPALLYRLQRALQPVTADHAAWLQRRQVVDLSRIYSVDYSALSLQDQLDLHLRPGDHILDDFGDKPIDGPAFADVRNRRVVGVCIRNVSVDLAYVAQAKYTFSNFGWHLWGYDLYQPDDHIHLVEGVFDAIALRSAGMCAVALGSAYPSVMQLACVDFKLKKVSVCFDNDFSGHCGAYMAARLLGADVLMPTLKDVSCSSEAGKPIELAPTPLPSLYDQVVVEIAAYNKLVASGADLVRDLPYNLGT